MSAVSVPGADLAAQALGELRSSGTVADGARVPSGVRWRQARGAGPHGGPGQVEYSLEHVHVDGLVAVPVQGDVGGEVTGSLTVLA